LKTLFNSRDYSHKEIANKLFRVLTDRNDGYGLAANQIGIQKQVCVVNVKKPYYFINPRIVEAEGELYYYESCLSFPNQHVRTKRYATIVVEADNYDGQLYFDVDYLSKDDRGMNNIDVIEMVALQHEISHLEGKTVAIPGHATMQDFLFRKLHLSASKREGRSLKTGTLLYTSRAILSRISVSCPPT